MNEWAATNTLRKGRVYQRVDAKGAVVVEQRQEFDTALALVEAALDAAEEWWQSKRPVTWTDAEHAAQPFVNCIGPQEQALAAALRAVREGK